MAGLRAETLDDFQEKDAKESNSYGPNGKSNIPRAGFSLLKGKRLTDTHIN
jgi:hypothetical protein